MMGPCILCPFMDGMLIKALGQIRRPPRVQAVILTAQDVDIIAVGVEDISQSSWRILLHGLSLVHPDAFYRLHSSLTA